MAYRTRDNGSRKLNLEKITHHRATRVNGLTTASKHTMEGGERSIYRSKEYSKAVIGIRERLECKSAATLEWRGSVAAARRLPETPSTTARRCAEDAREQSQYFRIKC